MYQFKNLMDIQKKYDYFCEEHGKQLNEVQEDIDLILHGKDRSGKHIDETLEKAKNLLSEQLKIAIMLVKTSQALHHSQESQIIFPAQVRDTHINL